MVRAGAVFAGFLFVMPAVATERVPAEIKACRAERDERTRLACFDAALAKLEAAPSDFGGEALKRPEAVSQEPEFVSAHAARVAINAIQHFTVSLDNGQVWRQLDSDTEVAHFREGAAVRIKRGFLDSYSLSVEGTFGSYKVKRIK
ncbi:MAG: hypothetical protein P4L57_04760 [Rhizomicrobium sp.]|nr:hypothetical protein [Rhizomicrobium sp.]